MTPSRLHVPPRPIGASAKVCAAPPAISSRLSLPSAKNPIERLSGDQKGYAPPSVPASGRTEPASSERSHKRGWPSELGGEHKLLPVGRQCQRHLIRGRWRRDLETHLACGGGWTEGRCNCHRHGDNRDHRQQRGHDPREPLTAEASDDRNRRGDHGRVGLRLRIVNLKSARRRCRGGAACGSFSRQRRSNRRTLSDVVARQPTPSLDRRSRIAAIVSEMVSPGNAGSTSQHFVQHAAERPDVGPLVDRLAPRLLRAHVGGRAENDAFARPSSSSWAMRQIRCRAVSGRHLRQPEVQHLHRRRPA